MENLSTLDEQITALENALIEADEIKAKKNSFPERLLAMAQARRSSGDDSPLTPAQLECLTIQNKVNERTRKTKKRISLTV